jgi:hypothetical protein
VEVPAHVLTTEVLFCALPVPPNLSQQLLARQPWDDPYIPRTYPHLLKWKFRHMNSVDFKLAAMPGQQPRLLLNCAMRRKHGSTDINHLSLQGERVCALYALYCSGTAACTAQAF